MSQPRTVWALESYRAGETTQILGLAEAVGRAFDARVASFVPQHRMQASTLGLLQRVSAEGLASSRPVPLAPPWPELLIAAGLRNEPIARWVRAQSAGRTRIVFLGRVWTPAQYFDLVVVTPQYRFPAGPTVLENDTTLHRVYAARLAEARAAWTEQFAALPRPRRLALVGGDSGPYALRARAARALAAALRGEQQQGGGSLLVSTSSRTHAEAVAAIDDALPDAYRYHYRASDVANPYFGMLAWADEIVVTSDSIAMISEALAVGVPVALFDLARGSDSTTKSRAYRALMRIGPERLARDIGVAHERLLQAGRIRRLGAPVELGQARTTGPDIALERTLARIAPWFDGSRRGR